MVTQPRFDIPMNAVEAFCKKWGIRELALFGSVLRDDFRPDSDIDVLVTFDENAAIGLPALVRMQKELSTVLGREVDIVPRDAIEESTNTRRRTRILESARIVYAA